MLARRLRMTDGTEFRTAVRGGRRIGGTTIVLHVHRSVDPESSLTVGFVVSKAVGNAVTRNRVKRRLRHLVADAANAVEDSESGSIQVVIRALPAASSQPARLAPDFERAWRKAFGRAA